MRDAIGAFEGALTLQPDEFWARYQLALCHLRSGRPAEAKVGLLACLARRPDSFWTRLLLATAESELLETDAAEANFAQVLKQAPDPAASAVVLTNRGGMRVRQRRWEEAIDDLGRAIATQPDSAGAYLNLAQAYRGRKDWNAAVAALDEAIDRHLDSSRLYRERALFQLERGDREAAERDFDRAIARFSAGGPKEELADDHVQLAHLYHLTKDYPAALAECDAALKASPDYPPAQRQRAEALIALNRHAEAGEALDRYLRRHPAEPAAYLARAIIYQSLHQYTEAIMAYSQALALKEDAKTFSYRGWAYLDLDAPKPALADFEEALRLDQANLDALLGRAHAKARLGKAADAVKDARAALEHGPRDRRLLLATARIFALAAGQPDEAGRGQLASRYAEEAVHLLRLALEQVRREDQRKALWRESVQSEKSFLALRRLNEFQELARRYGS